MAYRPHYAPQARLFGYDPVSDLAPDHLARLVEAVVEETVRPKRKLRAPGRPQFDPRLLLKVLVYGYATGSRSSRQLERMCNENLAYLFLTRGDTPSYRTLCSARKDHADLLEQIFVGLLAFARAHGLKQVGRIVVDSTRLRANASPEAVLTPDEYEPLREELQRILAEAEATDAQEEEEGHPGQTCTGQPVEPDQLRDILRRVRAQRRRAKRAKKKKKDPGKPAEPATTAEATPEAAAAAETPPSESPAAASPAAADQPTPASPATPPNAQTNPDHEPDNDPSPEGKQPAPTTPPTRLTKKRIQSLKQTLAAVEDATERERPYLCLTDPDAEMMRGGRQPRLQEGHSLEVAVDEGSGLLVVGQTTQCPHDNQRLEPLVAAAEAQEPGGIQAVTGDSGYYGGDAVGRLLERGIDVCVPDSHTVRDVRRGQPVGTTRALSQGTVAFEYDAEADLYRCPEGNELRWREQRRERGQLRVVYRAVRPCTGCPRAGECLTRPGAQYRPVRRGQYGEQLEAARQRFNEPEQQRRYRQRAPQVEGVFGYLRGALGFNRWLLRGKAGVAAEGKLMVLGYQLRKLLAAAG